MKRPVAWFVGCAVVMATPGAFAKGKLWLVIDQSTEKQLAASSMIEDFWACTLNATDFNDFVGKYKGPSLRPAQPLDFGRAVVADTSACGTPDSPGWEPMLQCVVNAAQIVVADGDYIHYIPPIGGFDARNCTLCNVVSANKTVSIRAAITRSGKASDFTFAGIHEAFEAVTYGGSDDCCNGYYANNVPEAASCISLFGSSGGELTVQCGYRGYQEQRVTFGVRSNGYFYGEDCTPLKVTAAANSPESVCTLPKAQRLAGKCINGSVVSCEYVPNSTACANGCVEDVQGAHCAQLGASCTLTAAPSVCSGSSTSVSVTCKNTGTATWNSSLALVTTPDADSAFADPSWISARSPAHISGAPIAPSGSGSFAFVARGPLVTKITTGTQVFSLHESDAGAVPSAATLVIDVVPCQSDAGADGGEPTDPPIEVPGCSCNETGRGRQGRLALVGVVFAMVLLGMRRRHSSS